jgi:DNA-binding response OmpR family regulator
MSSETHETKHNVGNRSTVDEQKRTNPGMMESFVTNYAADLMIVDAVPSKKMIERLDALKTLNTHLSIIMLYVYSPREVDLDSAVREHVDSIFYKPFDVGDVAHRIEELLRK